MNPKVLQLILLSIIFLSGYIILFIQNWKIAIGVFLIHWCSNIERRISLERLVK